MKSLLEKNFSNVLLAIFSQLIVLILGFFKSILLPASMSINDFGYWQLYLLYISYIGFFFLGYNDAILLIYNKYDLEEMPKDKIRSGNFISILVLVLFSIIILICSLFCEENKKYVLIFYSFSIPVWGIFGILIYIYLSSNNTKKYTLFNLLDQVIFLFFLVYGFRINNFDYRFFIISMFISKIITVILMIIDLRDFVFGYVFSLKESIKIYYNHVKIGIFVMLSLIFSILLSGFGKIIIEMNGTIENFAAYSFGMSISNLIVAFVSSVGTILYPSISRLNLKQKSLIFEKMYLIIRNLNVFGLLLYFFICFILQKYFNKYISLLDYFQYIFLAVMIQNKILLLYNSYYKILRREKNMLFIYCVGISIPFVFANTIYNLFNDISQVAFISMITVILLDIYSNIFLSKILKVKINLIGEYFLYFVFILLSYIKYGSVIYIIMLMFYFFIKYKQLRVKYLFLK